MRKARRTRFWTLADRQSWRQSRSDLSHALTSSDIAANRALERLDKLEHADIAAVKNPTQIERCIPYLQQRPALRQIERFVRAGFAKKRMASTTVRCILALCASSVPERIIK